MQVIARERGGECLSTEYVTGPRGMRWRCAAGHEWSTSTQVIHRGGWCPTCAIRPNLEDMQALAAQHGGRCLTDSTAEDAHDTCMQWECALGHRFALHQRSVRIGVWCPKCRKVDSPWSRALARAESLGGVCLDTGAGQIDRSVRWRCANGHEWTCDWYRVANGSWCLRCKGRRLGIEDVQAMAAERGGRCLSLTFVNATEKLHWECIKGHRWWAIAEVIRHCDRWCPTCVAEARSPPRIVDAWSKALEQARAHGGVCLDPARGKSTVRWRCARGHEWSAAVYKIAAGRWCSLCSGRRLSIEHMHVTAAERGGRCISEKYVDCWTKLLWECERGHRWWAKPTVVRTAGTWCPHCAWDRNAERMRSEARDCR